MSEPTIVDQAEALRTERDTLAEQAKALIEERDALRTDLDALAAFKSQAEATIAELRASVETIGAERATAIAQAAAVTAELDAAKAALARPDFRTMAIAGAPAEALPANGADAASGDTAATIDKALSNESDPKRRARLRERLLKLARKE